MSKNEDAYAEAFTITDIFQVNGAMLHACRDQQEAWKRVRAKLIQAAQIQPPPLVIPPEICDENGDIIPGAVANPQA